MLGLETEWVGKPHRMPDTILSYNYNFSGQWARNAATDATDKPNTRKSVHRQVSTCGSEEADFV